VAFTNVVLSVESGGIDGAADSKPAAVPLPKTVSVSATPGRPIGRPLLSVK